MHDICESNKINCLVCYFTEQVCVRFRNSQVTPTSFLSLFIRHIVNKLFLGEINFIHS